MTPARHIRSLDADRIRSALQARERADVEVRQAVLEAVSNGASVRALAGLTGMSTNTISRWKREQR